MQIGLLLPGMVVFGTLTSVDDVPEELAAQFQHKSVIPKADPTEFVVLTNAEIVTGGVSTTADCLMVLNSQILGRVYGQATRPRPRGR